MTKNIGKRQITTIFQHVMVIYKNVTIYIITKKVTQVFKFDK